MSVIHNQVRNFTCERCRKVFATDLTYVRKWPIEKWWQMVGQQCANCRVEAQGEPAQGGFHLSGPSTELAAARHASARNGTLRREVIRLLSLADEGLTDDEGGALMGGDRLMFGRRRSELVKSGLVRDTGQRRPTPTGRSAVVWKLA